MGSKIWILVGVLVAAAYLAGRYSAPFKVTTETKIDTTKDQIIQELNRQLAFKSSDKIKITTTVYKPDGTKIIRVKIENKNVAINVTSEAKKDTSHEVSHEETKTITQNRQGVVVGPMVNFTTSDFAHPLYGAVFDAPVFGPFHVLGNVLVGSSVGLSFGLAGGWEF